MKKNCLVLSILLIGVLKFGFSQKKAGVVTFYVSKEIDFKDLGANASLAKTIAKLADDESFNLNSVLSNFHSTFFNEYAKSFPFTIVDEKIITENEKYKSFESKFGETNDAESGDKSQRYLTPDGYKPVFYSALKKENRGSQKMLDIFNELDGVMFISLDYAFVPKTAVAGMGSAGIKARINMTLFNKEGKKVFNIFETAMSKESVPLIKGVPVTKTDKILPLCEDATEKLLEDLKKKLPKIAKKSAAKF